MGHLSISNSSICIIKCQCNISKSHRFSLKDLTGKIIEIYQDDLIVYSKDRNDNVKHLRQVFERCRKYVISLNPKKSIFGVDEGKLLVHKVSKEGFKIDLERIEDTKEIHLSINKKLFQSFFGKINFIQRFIPNFIEITTPI